MLIDFTAISFEPFVFQVFGKTNLVDIKVVLINHHVLDNSLVEIGDQIHRTSNGDTFQLISFRRLDDFHFLGNSHRYIFIYTGFLGASAASSASSSATETSSIAA